MTGTLRIWMGLVGAPLAWLAQVLLSEAASAHACYPHDVPLAAPLWRRLPLAVIGLNMTCLAVALVASAIVWHAWRNALRKGERDAAIEEGKTRGDFLIMMGALSCVVFLVCILFTASAVFLVGPCRRW